MAELGFKLKSLASSKTKEKPACSSISGAEFRIIEGECAPTKNSVRSRPRSRPEEVAEHLLEQGVGALNGSALSSQMTDWTIPPFPRATANLLISNGNSLIAALPPPQSSIQDFHNPASTCLSPLSLLACPPASLCSSPEEPVPGEC